MSNVTFTAQFRTIEEAGQWPPTLPGYVRAVEIHRQSFSFVADVVVEVDFSFNSNFGRAVS